MDQATGDGAGRARCYRTCESEGVTIKKMIDQYLEEYEKIRPLGKTKRATLTAIKETWLGEVDDSALNSQKLVEFAQWRMSKEGAVSRRRRSGMIYRTSERSCRSLGRPGGMR